MIKEKIDMYRYKSELDVINNKKRLENCTLFYGSSTFVMMRDCEEYFKKYNAINAGFGGSTAHEGLYHYDLAASFKPKILCYYFGDNDPVCDYTLEETEELFLKTWLKFKEDFPLIKIITLGTKTSRAREEYKTYVQELNKWQKEMANKYDFLTFIDTSDLCLDKGGNYIKENFCDDELHFSPLAYVTIKERFKKAIEDVL